MKRSSSASYRWLSLATKRNAQP